MLVVLTKTHKPLLAQYAHFLSFEGLHYIWTCLLCRTSFPSCLHRFCTGFAWFSCNTHIVVQLVKKLYSKLLFLGRFFWKALEQKVSVLGPQVSYFTLSRSANDWRDLTRLTRVPGFGAVFLSGLFGLKHWKISRSSP